MSSKPEIFFSYAWGDKQGKSREKIVNELYQSLKADGYNVVMDKHDLGYKGMITDFMRRIGKGQFVVVAISDKYLKSPFCMYELIEIYRKSNSEIAEMKEKIFPIVLSDAKIYTPLDRLGYIDYWKKEKDTFEGKIQEVGLEYAVDLIEDFKLYREITSNMGILTQLFKNMNTLNLQLLKADNFKEIKKAIEERIATIPENEAPKNIKPVENKTIPHALTAPPFRSPLFLGRDADMQALEQMLSNENKPLLLVNGMGGIGKTSLAAHYYHLHSSQYTHTAWLLNKGNITDTLLQLATPLHVDFDAADTAALQLEKLLTAMSNLTKPCLLVIDNADDGEDLEASYITLCRLSNFRILLTTRVTKKIEATAIYAVGALPFPQALTLFIEYYTQHNREDDNLFQQLYDAVDGNTLIIELLAKNLEVLNEVHTRYSLAQLVHDLQQGLLSITQTKAVDTQYHTDTLLKAEPLEIIEAMYNLSELSGDEKRILSIMAVLPAENIAFTTLQTLLPATATLGDTLTLLSRKGWLEYNRTEGNFKISPVIQEITRKKNQGLLDDCRELLQSLTNKLEYDHQHITGCGYAEAPLNMRYAESVIGQFVLGNPVFDLLLERLGSCHGILGNLSKALYFYELNAQLCQTLCEANPKNERFKNAWAIAHERLGTTYANMGNLKEALRFYMEYNALRQQLYEAYPDNIDFKNGLAISYSKLGDTYTAMGNLKEALGFYQLDADLTKQLFEAYPDNVDFMNGLAISYEKLGNSYAEMENLSEALRFYELEVALFKQLYEAYPDNVNLKKGLAISYSKMGDTYTSIGDLNEALRFYTDYNSLRKQLYEAYPDNVNFKDGLAIAYSKLGNIYAEMDNLTEALRFYTEYNVLRHQLYEAYPDNVNFKNGLAVSYTKLGNIYKTTDTNKTRQYFTQAAELWEELVAAAPQYAKFQQHLDWVKNELATL